MITRIQLLVFIVNIPFLVLGMNCYICSRTVECRNRSYKEALESIQREEYIEGGDDAPVRRIEVIGDPIINNDISSLFGSKCNLQAAGLNAPIINNRICDFSTHSLIHVGEHYLLHRSKRQSVNISSTFISSTSTTNNLVENTIYQFGIIAGTSFLGALFLTDTLPDYPLPGEPGGGASPTGFLNEQQRQALSLTPPNRKPLAVFPPFSTPRTFPARAVIFRERPGLDDKTENPASFPSIQWLRENIAIFRRRAPKLFSCINLDTDLVGYRVQYNYTCLGNSSKDCVPTNLLNGKEEILDHVLQNRQSGENFCSGIENECRLISSGELSWMHTHRVKRQGEPDGMTTTPSPNNVTVTTLPPPQINSSRVRRPIITNSPVRDAIYGGGILVAGTFFSILSVTDALPTYSLPGESGGGVSPNQVSTDLQREALELTPINTIPLTIFPPFRTMRTFPAVAVIFKETTSSNSPPFLSLQWFRSLLQIFRRRSPELFSSINLEEDLVGYAVRYNYTCFGMDEFTCQIPFNFFKPKRRQGSESFCTRSSPNCRIILNTLDCKNNLSNFG